MASHCNFPDCDPSTGQNLGIFNGLLTLGWVLGQHLIEIQGFLPQWKQVTVAIILSLLSFGLTKLYSYIWNKYFCK